MVKFNKVINKIMFKDYELAKRVKTKEQAAEVYARNSTFTTKTTLECNQKGFLI